MFFLHVLFDQDIPDFFNEQFSFQRDMFHSDIECVTFAENVYQDQGEMAQISDEK